MFAPSNRTNHGENIVEFYVFVTFFQENVQCSYNDSNKWNGFFTPSWSFDFFFQCINSRLPRNLMRYQIAVGRSYNSKCFRRHFLWQKNGKIPFTDGTLITAEIGHETAIIHWANMYKNELRNLFIKEIYVIRPHLSDYSHICFTCHLMEEYKKSTGYEKMNECSFIYYVHADHKKSIFLPT